MGDIERVRLGRYEIALRDYDEVLTRYPEHPDAFAAVFGKAETWSEGLRDPERAVQVLLEGVARQPDHARAAEALERAARLREKDGRDARAAAVLYEQLSASYPRHAGAAKALYHAGELLEKAGDRDRARALYLEVQRRFPDDKLAAKASQRVAKLAASHE